MLGGLSSMWWFQDPDFLHLVALPFFVFWSYSLLAGGWGKETEWVGPGCGCTSQYSIAQKRNGALKFQGWLDYEVSRCAQKGKEMSHHEHTASHLAHSFVHWISFHSFMEHLFLPNGSRPGDPSSWMFGYSGWCTSDPWGPCVTPYDLWFTNSKNKISALSFPPHPPPCNTHCKVGTG